MKTAVFSAVYPGVEHFLPDFFLSLQKQNDQDFEVYIMNDGLADLSFIRDNYGFNIHLKEVDSKGYSPAKIRKIGLSWLVSEKVDIVIFADADDYFSANRVRVSKELLKAIPCDAVVNELLLVGNDFPNPQPMFGKRFPDGTQITTTLLTTGNCCGLSNTAVYLDQVTNVVEEISDNIIAFDWLLFTKLLLAGGKVTYTNQTFTYYRQHGRNIASPYLTTENHIMSAFGVKLAYYEALQKVDPFYYDKFMKYSRCFERLQHEAGAIEAYIKQINKQQIKHPLWWEMIQPLEE